MNENVMSRTKAREIALHLIFEMGFQQFEPENLEERLDENIMRSLKTDAEMYAGRLSVENAGLYPRSRQGRCDPCGRA